MPRCSVIIPVYNKAHLTRQCVDRLLKLPASQYSFEIIVVDDGSRDSTPQLLAGYGGRVRVVTHKTNKAFATSCNDGAAIAQGQYLVFLNNDTIPFPGWLDALVRYVEVRPRAGLVASKLLYPNGTIQHAGMAICQDYQPRLIYVGFPADHPAVNKARRMQVVSGACNLIPRELFTRLGGFDTAYINSYEDLDLCHRVTQLGYEVHYCPESVLIHYESVSEGRHRFEAQSGVIYHQRWAGKFPQDDVQYYLEDGLIRIEYFANHLEFTISPEVGVARVKGEFGDVEKVLALRAKQVYALIRENNTMRAAGTAPVPPPVGVN